jgi:hypothetical protein
MLMFVSLVLCAFGQTTGDASGTVRLRTEAGVADLSLALRPDNVEQGATLSPLERERTLSQIHGAIDAYVARAVDPKHLDLKSVEQDLRAILGPHEAPAEYGDLPSSFGLDQAGERFLLVAYALQTGLHGIRTSDWLAGTVLFALRTRTSRCRIILQTELWR